MAVPNEDCPFVTKDFLTDILRRYESKDDLRVIDFTLRRLRPAEKDYITKVRGITATVVEAGDTKQYSMVVKVVQNREDCHVNEKLVREMLLFEKEELSYTLLIPAMEKIVTRGGGFLNVPAPSLIKSESEGTKFILLGDLTAQGYRVTSYDDKLDYDHCKLVVEGLATFHALSVALGRGSVENLRNDYEILFLERDAPGPMTNAMKNAARFNLDVCLKVLRTKISEKKMFEFIDKLEYKDASNLFERAFAPDSTFNVVCHRDFKPGNMMFKYADTAVGKKVVSDFKFIDLQIVTVGSPAVDLVAMLFTSTTAAFRRQYLDKILHDYYSKFIDILHRADVAVPDCFTFDMLLQHFRERAGFGVVYSWIMYMVFSQTTARGSIAAADRYDREIFEQLCKDILHAGDDDDIVQTFQEAVEGHYFVDI